LLSLVCNNYKTKGNAKLWWETNYRVLSDYTSQVLDLSNPKVYRDLSSPMGALSAQRAAKFRERYENWDAAEEGVPKWHYG